MKKIILIIAIIAFVGCKEEAPTENKITIQKEYTLEELENDTNWVEITEYEILDIPCLKVHDLEDEYYFNTDEDYQVLSNYFYDNSSCAFNSLPEVDFNKKEVIGVSYADYPIYENDEFKMKVFHNSIERQMIIYCETIYDTTQVRNKISYLYRKWIELSTNSYPQGFKFIYNSNLWE